MQSMQPIPIERALVPLPAVELSHKRKTSALSLAFSERKHLYAVFFAIFFVFAAAGAFAFPLLNVASEQLR